MKRFQLISLVNSLFLFSNVCALTLKSPTFSPYVDYTLNTQWDAETQDVQPIDLARLAQDQKIKALHLAFITDSGSCEPAWGGQQNYSIAKQWGKQQADLLARDGVHLTVAFGGASNNDISHNCDQKQLVEAFNQVITTYHASTLDFDIENGTANVPKLLQALKVVQQQHKKINLSFTLPTMPEGLTAEGKEVIRAASDAGLTFNVNIMAMDYGTAYAGDMGSYAIEATISLQQFLQEIYPEKLPQSLWKFIEVTPMIGVNDLQQEQFTLKNADQLRKFAEQMNLAALSMWSLNRDKPCAEQWTNPGCSGNKLQTIDYEFLAHFQG